jgi:hypothetical protein
VYEGLPGIRNMPSGHISNNWGSMLGVVSSRGGSGSGLLSQERDPECPRDQYGGCVTYVPTKQWAAIGTRINSIRATTPECVGAKNLLLSLYNAGWGSRRDQVLEGKRLSV